MTSTQLNAISPLETPLPPPRKGEVFTDSQWTTLMAIADTLIPSIGVSSKTSPKTLGLSESDYASAEETVRSRLPPKEDANLATRYLSENASSVPEFRELLSRLMQDYLHTEAQKGIRVVLSALDTRAGCLVMTGSSTSFHLQPANVREQILQGWSQSYLKPLRRSAKAFKGLTLATWGRTSPTMSLTLGFPPAPVHGKPGKGYEYSFLQFPPGGEPETVETDVVIIGSGCGGGVCAKNLAEAGQRVIVCEKAYHWGPEHMPMTSSDASVHLYQNGGVIGTDDGELGVVAAQAFGGGGTVNWSASLQTQGYVREEWAGQGLTFFTSSGYQDSLDRVCHRMGVSTKHIDHNVNNHMLGEGSRKLGFSHRDVPQNTGGNAHYCGYCTMGCGAAEKQGPVVSFLPDAERAGAQFIEGFQANKVIFEDVNGTKTATGVEGTWISRDSNGGVSGSDQTTRTVIIKAKRVIVSSGTIQSPLLLLRSQLRNPHIGRNLHLHPVTIVFGYYPDRPRFNPWEGGILTQMCDQFENLNGHGHGVKLECMTMIPSWLIAFNPWCSGTDIKTLATKMPWMSAHLPIARDRDTGRVYPDPVDGTARVAYTLSNFDRNHILEGVIAAAKIAYVEGAKEIWLCQSAIPAFHRATDDDESQDLGVNEPSFQAWLKTIRKRGLPPLETNFGTAHQMGTCRMATSERAGVVDPSGKVWGTEGLYVADASVFPSASGVNPMVTTMAISDFISRGVAKDLAQEKGVEQKARL